MFLIYHREVFLKQPEGALVLQAKKVILSWSSGKDSAYTLHCLRQSNEYEVLGLLTTTTEEYNRVAMHATRVTLLEEQARQANLALHQVIIPSKCTNDIYAQRMLKFLQKLAEQNIYHVAFGDLFLEDIRQYREQQLKDTGITAIFPLWQRNTKQLAHEMMRIGMKAVVTCIDLNKLDASFVGREFDATFLADLPEDVDPCGENGEFHTFVYEGPMLAKALKITKGEVIEREGFVYADFTF